MITLIIILILFSLLFAIKETRIKKAFSAKQVGTVGEKIVHSYLCNLPKEYKFIDDILLKNGAYTSQLDHVVIGPNGVFVIETKNYGGKITGDPNNRDWFCHYKKGSQFPLYNPLKQNETHIKALRQVEGFEFVPIYNIVCIIGDFDINDSRAIKPNELYSYITKLSPYELKVDELYSNLLRAELKGKAERIKHLKNVTLTQLK